MTEQTLPINGGITGSRSHHINPGIEPDVETIPIGPIDGSGRHWDLSDFLFTKGERSIGAVHYPDAEASFQFRCIGDQQAPNIAFRTLSLVYDTTVLATDAAAVDTLPNSVAGYNFKPVALPRLRN